MDERETTGRNYHPEASKKAILDAVEELFEGFEAVSIQEISTRTGVSRGTPGYFPCAYTQTQKPLDLNVYIRGFWSNASSM